MKDKHISKILFLIVLFVMFCAGAAVFYYLVVTNSENNQSAQETNNSVENSINNEEVIKPEEDEIDETGKVYSIKRADEYIDAVLVADEYKTFKLYEYNDTYKNHAEIVYMFTGYTTDPSFEYSLSIKDENDKEVLIKEDSMGPMSIAKIEKMELNQVLKITVEEKLINTQEVTKVITTEINLQEDLEDIEKIDILTDVEEITLGYISLKYPKSDDDGKWPVSNVYSTKLTGETFSTSINVQYGNYLCSDGNVNIRYVNNVNDFTLEEAFESLALITEKAGEYGLSDAYGLYITDDTDEIIDTVIVTFDEMIALCNGSSIEKDGVTYTGEDFDFLGGRTFEKIEDIKIAGYLDAIKYSDNSSGYEKYIFIWGGNIYEMSISKDERIAEEVQYIIDNITLLR